MDPVASNPGANGTKFENDLASPSSDPASCLPEIVELSKLTFARARAQKWALEDIKFLVFDDTGGEASGHAETEINGVPVSATQPDHRFTQNRPEALAVETTNQDLHASGYDSDVEEQMIKHAIELSREGNSYSQGSTPETGSRARSTGYSRTTCSVCSPFPESPHRSRPRTFRLVRPAVTDVCTHYVAVSYCCPPRNDPTRPSTYLVRDLDGRRRPSRALDDVLDRAVDFANSCGLRMIWIDQECLPQPEKHSPQVDKDEQQLGVQSMDIVYNRATLTAGLLDVEILSQPQLDAIKALLYYSNDRIQRIVSRGFVRHILDFLYRIAQDRWYTRAWVIQESLCAGHKLTLTFRLIPGLKTSSAYRKESHDADRPPHSLDFSPAEHESRLLIMPLREFWIVVDRMKQLLAHEFVSSGGYLIRTNNGPTYSLREAGPIIEAAETLHPRFRQVHLFLGELSITSRGHYGKRPTIDAAGALTLLNQRECLYDSDRVAILANMCDFNFRLDTQAIQNSCGSLKQAIFALTLNNGDLSILVPEVYAPSNSAVCSADEAVASSSSILFREFTRAEQINHARVRNFINIRIQTAHPGRFTPTGLQLPAYLWTVDTEADFTLMKLKWKDEWDNLKCWHFAISKQKGETEEGFHLREQEVTRRFLEPGIDEVAHQEFREYGYVPDESVVWDGIDNRGVHVDRVLVPQRIKRESGIRDVIARVIFDILRYTLTMSKIYSYAQGLANNIWQSIRVDRLGGVGHRELPDQVTDALFVHEDVVSRPFDTFQFDETQEELLAQLWFVERIMKHGTIWCGRYNRSWRPLDLEVNPHVAKRSVPAQDTGTAEPGPSSVSDATRGSQGPFPYSPDQTILSKQGTRTALVGGLTSRSEHVLDSQVRSVMTYMESINNDLWSSSAEDKRETTLSSTFDVDGPCTVATPYNPDWELFPRPELRSMSTCWVLEPVKPEHKTPSDEPPLGAQSEKSKGKRKASEMHDTSGLSDVDKELAEIYARPLGTENGVPAYEVLRKVKGLWQIMTLPSQEYVFR